MAVPKNGASLSPTPRRRKGATDAAAATDGTPGRSVDDDLFVVGIGASAGGLEALRPLVSNLPALSNMTYVVVQHLAPQYRSMLAQILGRDTQLSIAEITDGMPIQRNTIYITPPNKDVIIRNSTLWLRKPSAPVGPKPSVDAFFVSLAEDKGEKAIGIILSGTGSDGAHGMRALKANTGYTIVQDPETTKYDGMPKAAIETGCVDRLMPPDQIGQELASIAQFPRLVVQKAAESAGLDTLEEIFLLVRHRTDVDFSQYKSNTVRRRLERRMAANRIETLECYLDFVHKLPQELDLLCKDILISVTSFFRDPKAFRDLGDLFPQILKDKLPGDSIRIWVPGCATGEEAYSLAMLLYDHLGKKNRDYTVQIFATDIDQDAMSHARRGLYSEETIKNLDRDYIGKYFDQIGPAYQVRKFIREMVVFARQDLVKDPPFVRVDLISCRNVMIYFNTELQSRVFSMFHYALNSDGHLFLGKSESVGHHTDLFKPVRNTAKLFSKRANFDSKGVPMFGQFRPKSLPEKSRREAPRKKSVTDLMYDAFIAAYAPDSVVVNDNYDIIHFHENVETFMRLPRGTPNLNLSKLIIDDFRSDLRVLLHRTRKEGEAVAGMKRRLETKNGTVLARLVVRPLLSPGATSEGESLFLVSCETEKPLPQDNGAPNQSDREEDAELRIAELEQELVATKENLQTVVEELETSNEELQALNEELQAANEELQSSNEELETSNEELQSTNEELTTVNEELQVRTVELSETNTDMENIQNNIGFALIVVDKQLHVTRFTPQAIRMFGLLNSDIGQTITSVPSYTDVQNLRPHLQEVILSGSPFEDEIRSENNIYRMRIVPYRDHDGKIGGAILSFIDETEIRNATSRLKEQEEWVRQVTDSVPVMIYYVDRNERFGFCNQPVANFYGTSVMAVQGKIVKDVVGAKAYRDLKPHIDNALAGEAQTFEWQDRNADGEPLFLRATFQPHFNEPSNILGYFAIITDVTDAKMGEAALMKAKEIAEEANQAKSNFLANMSHELRTPLNAIMAFSEIIRLEQFGAVANPKYKEYATDIHESGRHLLKMIGEILDLSKVEANMVDLEESAVDIPAVVIASERLIAERAQAANLSIRNDLSASLPRLYADETMIKRILINLLTNAVKFTPAGGKIAISSTVDTDGYSIVISDTGVGIPPQDIDRVLEPFEQVRRSDRSDRRDGVGLGLSITKSLVKLHGGVLHIASTVGKGTVVTATFPPNRIVT